MTRFALCVAANRLRIPAGLILGLLSASFLVRPAAAATVVRVTMDGASSVTPHMAMGADGKCRLVWSDNRTGNSEIFFTMLDAWGNRLLPDIQVSHSPTTSSTVPRVDVDAAGFAYVCWVEGANIWLARIDPTGHTTDSTAVSFGFNYVGELPDIDVTPSSGLGVAFTSQASGLDEDYQVLFDSGLNKLCQRKMFTNVTWLDRHVTERCDDDLHCTMYWQSVAFGNNYLSGGAITPTCGDDGSGNICVGNDYSTMSNHSAGLVVQKGTRVYLGNGGGCPTAFSEAPGPSVAHASRDLDANRCVIAWDDSRNGNHDIYFAMYNRSTLARIGVDSLLAGGTSSSTTPSVTTDLLGTTCVAWTDNRDGNNEIYFARTPEPGSGTIVGTVYNAVTGAPMPFAQVDVVYPDRPVLKIGHVFAGADGKYRLAGLAPSQPWALTATALGFTSPQISGVVAPPGQTVTVDLRVSTGSVLSGTIRDSYNHLPIGTALVRVDSVAGTVSKGFQTGPDGRFRFDLYPGHYRVHVDVPALGQAGPFLSLANPYYLPDSVMDLTVAASPPPMLFEMKSNTVVLVHGIRSTSDYWGTLIDPAADTMRKTLETARFHTEALSYDWKRTIEEGGRRLSRWLEPNVYRSSRVVAHSMGGLVSRWCAEQIEAPAGRRPFSEIITLGTLHHGTPAASNGVEFVKGLIGWPLARTEIPGLDQLGDLAAEAAIRKWIPFVIDFEPGSERLNQLNYGPGHSGFDGDQYCLSGRPDPIHAAEVLLPDVKYVAMAGDSPQNFWWSMPFMNGCRNDGAVPVHSAKLYNGAAEFALMSCYGGVGCNVRHVTQDGLRERAATPATVIEFRNSICVRQHVVDALNGLSVACSGNQLVLGDAAVNDTLLSALPAFEHLVAPGGSVSDTIVVPAGATLAAIASWRQDGLAFDLEDPSSAHIDSAACVGVAGRRFDSDPANRWSQIVVTGASGGTWILHATSVADSAQTVGLQPFISSDVTLDAAASPGFVAPGTPILVSATLRRAGAALTGAAVTGVVAGSNGTTAPLVLVDDGTAGDLFAGDGVYSALFTPGGAGSYAARVVANGGAGPSYGGRQATTAIEAGPSVDVLIPNASLSAPSPWTYPSDPLAFSFRVRNDGALAADSVWVVAYDDSVGSAFLDTVIVIPAHDSIPLVATFRATQPGLHSLRFSATALGSVVDANPGNSLAMRGAEIVPFGGAPTLVSVDPPATKRFAPVYLATRSVPNPTRGATSLEFYLPRSAPRVVLRVLDVTGRQVTQSELGGFASGWQRAAWSPDRDAGGRVSPGVYLYRLECSGMVGQGRFVVVR